MRRNRLTFLVAIILLLTLALTSVLISCDKAGNNDPDGDEEEVETIGTYTITIHTGMGDVRTVQYSSNSEYLAYTAKDVQGYTFIGLFDAAKNGAKYVDVDRKVLIKITRNIELYECFNAETYTIRFESDTPEINAPKDVLAKVGDPLVLPLIEDTQENKFVGYTDKYGEIYYSNGNEIINEYSIFRPEKFLDVNETTRTVTLYISTDVNVCIINFIVGDQTIKVPVVKGTNISKVNVSNLETIIESEGNKVFGGWSLYKDSKDDIFQDDVVEEINLYPIILNVVEVKYYLSVDSEPIIKKAVEDQVIDFIKPSKVGYEFVGWYKDPSLSGNPVRNAKASINDVDNIFYAKFTGLSYILRFNGPEEIVLPEEILIYPGTEIVLPDVGDLGAYRFLAWTNKNGTIEYSNQNNELINGYNIFDLDKYVETNHADRTLDFYLKSEDKYVDLTFDFDGTIINKHIKYGSKISDIDLSEETNKYIIKGFIFSGFSKIKGPNNKDFEYTNIAIEDVTLYPIIYKAVHVNFYEKDNLTCSEELVKEGVEYTLYTPDKIGYDFLGWYDNEGFSGNAITKFVPDSANTYNFYAKWEKAIYTITYVTNSATSIPQGSYSYQEEKFLAMAEPDNQGYEFLGWRYKENSAEVPMMKLPKDAIGDITLYAVYQPKEFKITFNSNGGSQLDDLYVKYDTSYHTYMPTKPGYEFMGWYSDLTDGAQRYTDQYGQSFSNYKFTSDMTFYAKWQVAKYTVIFDTMGGNMIAPKTVEYGIVIAKPGDPRKTGFIFKGWYLDKEYVNPYNFENPVTEDIVLYAKWEVR